MATLEIRLLGEFAMFYNGAPLNGLGGTRAQNLLAYLLLHRDAPVARQRLAFLFWPDSVEAQARTNLRSVLHSLMQALPESDRFVQVEGQTVQWRADGPFRLDVDDFGAAVKQAESADQLRDAVALYTGELLPDCYDDWIASNREQLAETYRNSLQRLVDLLEKQGEFGEAVAQAKCLVRHDPLREHVWRQIMRLHALNGDRAGVARAFRECKAVLERELDVQPSVETEAAFEQWKRYGEPANGRAEPLAEPAESFRVPAGTEDVRTNYVTPWDWTASANSGWRRRIALPRWSGLATVSRIVSVCVLVLLAGVLAYWFVNRDAPGRAIPPAAPTSSPVLALKGCMGGSKEGLLKDPDVQRILLDRYKLSVVYEKMGSVEMVQRCTAGYDFVWPGTEADVARFKQKLGPNITYETPLSSVLVLYSWVEITDELLKQGIIAQDANGAYFIADEAHTAQLLRWLTEGKDWSLLGLPQLRGHFRVVPTDPSKSESGGIFAVYLTSMLLGGDVPDVAAALQAMPQVHAYFDSLGFLEQSTGQLFVKFLKEGMGAKPIIVAYESQGIEKIAEDPQREQILKKMRIIYPRPTVWVSHPLIALTDAGKKLLEALKDQEIQAIAWKKHGFRSGVAVITNDPNELLPLKVPASIDSTLALPQPAVMDLIVDELSK